MALVLAIRDFPAPMSLNDILIQSADSAGCMEAWNLTWLHSFRNPANNRMLCFFDAPDAESVRMSIRQSGWTGDALVKSMNHITTSVKTPATIVVERHFDAPVKFEDLQSLEEQHGWCLSQYRVAFVESYFSLDRKTMLCLYQAPDAESVRKAQQQATVPFNSIWAFQKLDGGALP